MEQTGPIDREAIPSFAQLNLAVGTGLTIETLSPVRKLPVKLLGYVEPRSILVSAPLRDGKEIYLEKGSSVVVRMMDGCRAYAFETHVLYRSVQPFSYYHLAYPNDIESLQLRNAERIETELDTWVNSDFVVLEDWPKSARITNISKSGARMECDDFLGQSGHELILDFNLPVSGLNKRICLSGEIRNIDRQGGAQGDEHFVLGVEFREMNDETRLSLANYILEHH
ncbi:MAG: flagellar brake protein [Oleiphilaceae bacterium]|nr:flagellar brake protein [Oleiphilaceae bacterium]